jgi:hypothetical protein
MDLYRYASTPLGRAVKGSFVGHRPIVGHYRTFYPYLYKIIVILAPPWDLPPVRRVQMALVATLFLSFLIVVVPAPVPVISSLMPNSTAAGGSEFTLTVLGEIFVSGKVSCSTPAGTSLGAENLSAIYGSVVQWDGENRTTHFLSARRLNVTLMSGDLSEPGHHRVSVFTPGPDGGTSREVTFTVTDLAPGITGVSVADAVGSKGGFTLTVLGDGFLGGSQVLWNAGPLETTYISSTRLNADLPSSIGGTPPSGSVVVVNPPPDGKTSAQFRFPVPVGLDSKSGYTTSGSATSYMEPPGVGLRPTTTVKNPASGGGGSTTSYTNSYVAGYVADEPGPANTIIAGPEPTLTSTKSSSYPHFPEQAITIPFILPSRQQSSGGLPFAPPPAGSSPSDLLWRFVWRMLMVFE